MSARKIFAALILVLYASCSFAEVTPKQVLSDTRFSPLVKATKQHGAEYLPGRYVVTMELPSRTGDTPILAPTHIILEIGQPDPQMKTYPFRYDIHGGRNAEGYMFLDTDDGGKMYAGGQEIGTFTVDDNRITVTGSDGSKDTIYAMRNPYKDILAITFSTGPNGMGINAGVFERMNDSQKPAATPKMPTEFPPMPKVKMPPQAVNINGVWGAYAEGKQIILQYEGNNYFGWINGEPSEMGIFTINGNTITGTSSKGEKFTNKIELDDSGEFFDMTYTNGKTIRYQKLQ